MKPAFGPWTTSMHPGSKVELSTFWKRRIAMLALLDSGRQRISGIATFSLICAAVLALGVPTLRTGRAETQPQVTDSAAAPERSNLDDKPSAQDAEEQVTDGATFTIKGVVLSPTKEPIAGADVRVYETFTWSERLFAETKTDEHGRFQFESIPRKREGRWYARVVAIAPPFASRVVMTPALPSRDSLDYELELSEASSIKGWVVGPDQKPVSGAVVYTPSFKIAVPGVHSARTNDEGYFEVDDVPAWDSAARDAATLQQYGELQSWGEKRALRIRHPDYGRVTTLYSQVPTSVFVRFDRPMVVTGRIVYSGHREPAEGLQVTSGAAYAPVRTEEDGRYRLVMQPTERAGIGLVDGDLRGRTTFAGIQGASIELPDLYVSRPQRQEGDEQPPDTAQRDKPRTAEERVNPP